MEVIYGIKTDAPYNENDVRQAIVQCFAEAHGAFKESVADARSGISEEEMKAFAEMNAEQLVKNFFERVDGDYENPTQEDLQNVCDLLREYAGVFREKEMIQKNYEKILKLIQGLSNKAS